MKQIYMDYAAATPMSNECLSAMMPYQADQFYNPSATYLAAKAIKKSTEECRHSIASTIGARPAEIVFTAGGTEANNLAIQGIMNVHPGANIVVSAIEHESVLQPAGLYHHRHAPVDAKGRVDLAKLSKMIDESTVLVSVGLVNHELGVIQDIKEISRILRQIRVLRSATGNNTPLYLHTDAAQAGCYIDLNVARLDVDLMSVNGGKIYGPKQSGFLYVKTGVAVNPIILGGGQENGVRSGTENVAAIHGLSAAFLQAQLKRNYELERIRTLHNEFAKKLQKNIPNIIFNSTIKSNSPHICSITIVGIDNERIMMELDERGIMVALGSACSASSDMPSHVLSAIGLSDADARSTLRFSFGRQTTSDNIEVVVDQLVGVIKNQNR